jgi:hypothetical protein
MGSSFIAEKKLNNMILDYHKTKRVAGVWRLDIQAFLLEISLRHNTNHPVCLFGWTLFISC